VIEERNVPPTPYPTGFLWWFRNGDSWHAPAYNEANDGNQPYQPNIKNQFLRDFLWFCRNPIGNFMGFVIGFEGTAPVLLTTWYDARNEDTSWRFDSALNIPVRRKWKWSVINGWAPFVSYSGKRVLWYLGWRPSSGGFGFKFNLHEKQG
jgi:hypothetical protein